MARLTNSSIRDVRARIELIQRASVGDLRSPAYIENLMLALGMNGENPEEAPSLLLRHTGGLQLWQYPIQFAPYLALLSGRRVESYLEIGCRWGGTFVLTTEYLNKFNTVRRSVAVDIHRSPVKDFYTGHSPRTEFLQADSKKRRFHEFVRGVHFDVIFIDGDHDYRGVRHDFMVTQNSTDVFVFHDISNVACSGVQRFWRELKRNAGGSFVFHEFVRQYEEVLARGSGPYMGIGVAIRERPCPRVFAWLLDDYSWRTSPPAAF